MFDDLKLDTPRIVLRQIQFKTFQIAYIKEGEGLQSIFLQVINFLFRVKTIIHLFRY